MEVSWRDPQLVALQTGRQSSTAVSVLGCICPSCPSARDLAGVEGGSIAAARGAEELWEQRPCSQGRAQQPQLVVPFPYPLIKLQLDFIQLW